MSREKEYISIFRQYAEQIHDTIMSFNTYRDYYYAIELGNQFRQICNIIGRDPRFLRMSKFLNLVREKDREYIDYLRKFKRKVEEHPKIDQAEKPPKDKFKPLIEQFYLKVDQINPPVEGPKVDENKILNKKEREKRLYYRAKDWIKEHMNLSFTTEEEELINNFRKDITPEQKGFIQYTITPRDEMKILNKYAEQMIEEFVKLETRGW